MEVSDEHGLIRVITGSEEPIERLRALKSADRQVKRWLVEAVIEARKQGRSWSAIGAALGVSKQAAWQLYNTELESAEGSRRDRGRLIAREALALAAEELRQIRAGAGSTYTSRAPSAGSVNRSASS